MKGIVFTEFIEMVEQTFGYEMVDDLIESNDLPSGGSYTTIGTYEHGEMISLVTTLSQRTKAPVPDLLFTFGKYIFQSFTKRYPEFLEASDSFFDFLESIEKYIHVEVRKLYPDAELPKFETSLLDEKTLEMNYFSERRMGDFAMGLIESSMEYFGEKGTIDMNLKNDSGSEVQFLIKKL